MNIFYINLSIHLFTLDYDTTNKVGTKRAACQAGIDVGCGLGKEMITEEMVCNAQRTAILCSLYSKKAWRFNI